MGTHRAGNCKKADECIYLQMEMWLVLHHCNYHEAVLTFSLQSATIIDFNPFISRSNHYYRNEIFGPKLNKYE